jgi:hypothetical protein
MEDLVRLDGWSSLIGASQVGLFIVDFLLEELGMIPVEVVESLRSRDKRSCCLSNIRVVKTAPCGLSRRPKENWRRYHTTVCCRSRASGAMERTATDTERASALVSPMELFDGTTVTGRLGFPSWE